MERRKSRRFSVVTLDLYDNSTNQKVGNVVNISEGGMLTITDRSYETGKNYLFYIPFNETVNGMVKLEFSARIIWCHPNTLKPGLLSVGIEFSEIPTIQTKFIEQMVKIYGTS